MLNACETGAVAVTVTHPPLSVAHACEQVFTSLPQVAAGQPRRLVNPDSSLTAAWGEPPIVWRCGVPLPQAYSPTAQLLVVNQVQWLPASVAETSPEEERSPASAMVFTSIGKAANVEVHVPAHYSPEANILVDFTAAIKALPEASAAQ